MNIKALLSGVAMAALATSGADAQTVLKLGHVGDPGSLYEATAEQFR